MFELNSYLLLEQFSDGGSNFIRKTTFEVGNKDFDMTDKQWDNTLYTLDEYKKNLTKKLLNGIVIDARQAKEKQAIDTIDSLLLFRKCHETFCILEVLHPDKNFKLHSIKDSILQFVAIPGMNLVSSWDFEDLPPLEPIT